MPKRKKSMIDALQVSITLKYTEQPLNLKAVPLVKRDLMEYGQIHSTFKGIQSLKVQAPEHTT